MPRRRKSIEAESREKEPVEIPIATGTDRRRGVRVYPDELCPEWGNLPKQQQTMLVIAAARLGARQILQSPELRCALGIEKPEDTFSSSKPVSEDSNEEPETGFILDLGG